jgi:hypothetical protein
MGRKIVDYQIVGATTPERLNEAVKGKIANGLATLGVSLCIQERVHRKDRSSSDDGQVRGCPGNERLVGSTRPSHATAQGCVHGCTGGTETAFEGGPGVVRAGGHQQRQRCRRR